jgi:hypothetical protein
MACYIAINGVLSQRPSVELVHALIEHALLFGQYRNGQQEHDGLFVRCIGDFVDSVLHQGVWCRYLLGPSLSAL